MSIAFAARLFVRKVTGSAVRDTHACNNIKFVVDFLVSLEH